MKKYLHAWAMCQSMFCALPCPWQVWDEDARDRMLLFLPVVGLVIGGLWYGLAWAMEQIGLPHVIRALVLALYPIQISGGIHLDGFMDVCDAIGSYRPLERRREILKDSHVGAFAVSGCAVLLLAQFAALFAMDGMGVELILVPVLSRCGSALAVTLLPPMQTSQYAAQKRDRSVLFGLSGITGLTVAAALLLEKTALAGMLIGYGWALRRAYKSLEGMNGDISGYALTTGELCALLACVCV